MVEETKRILDYSQKGEIDYARRIFELMTHRDTVSWNVMIRGYVENHRISHARDVFDRMPERNAVSWNTMVMGYAQEGKTDIALKLFVVMPHKDVVAWTAIITGLSRASKIEDAWCLFKQIPEPNSVSWSSIISGFQHNGLAAESLNLFKEMLSAGVEPTSHSFTSALAASADLAMFSVSQQLYSQLLKRGFECNTPIGNSTISTFIKSGSFYCAKRVFVSLHVRDTVTWNSMIMGYGQHGYGREAIMVFHQMQKARFLPDSISFMGVLLGCSRHGFVEEGKRYFYSMEKDYGIPPGPEHYACLVDLLARSGSLKEATDVILEMPFEPTPIFWRTLLNGCKIWGDLELGVYAASQNLKLEPYNSSAHLIVSDIYAADGRGKEVREIRKQMREQEAKELGCSWVEIKGRIHLFASRDETHPESDCIYPTLKLLFNDMSECAIV
ncbi:pentatricopeptide repeat-containing protein At4g02750-like [Malania oleifera]|uniref:pentatricopeptide repeat-containing protein At4g02750-like n=1 Tax=Malania oleifera TaxID=397392 RepID=UPI0025AE3304|nr:pentatricopeptide repeat-containing protein At4g02750-like [Malania oleifera]